MRLILTLAFLWLSATVCCNESIAQSESGLVPVNSDQPYEMVEQMPQFIGDQKALLKHFKKHLKASGSTAAGLVVVSFVIHEDSTISDIRLLKPHNSVVDGHIVTAVQDMKGLWAPGKQFNKPVKVRNTIPIQLPLANHSFGQVQVTGEK